MQSTDASFRNIKPKIYGENQEILNPAVINQCFFDWHTARTYNLESRGYRLKIHCNL